MKLLQIYTEKLVKRSKNLLIGLVLMLLCITVFSSALFAQKVNEEYTELIKKFTTESFFMTKYVDHLPFSETVPTPLDILGRIAGAPDILSYSKDVYKYMGALAEVSPRVKLINIGKTEENRDMIVVIVSDEVTINDLDKYKNITAKLADPRKINDSEANKLIQEAKPIYWATGALHSGETGSPEMLMELAYRLAVGESDFIKKIRDNMIVMITPILDVDGRDKVLDVNAIKLKTPEADIPKRAVYWGKYVLHDNNRDYLGLGLNLTRNVLKTYFDFHPQVLHDLHESIAYLYVSTGTGPYNAWVDPILIDEWHQIAYQEVSEMTRMGVPGVWTHGFYDGWAPNYLFYVANGHNSIGRFYETQTAGDGTTKVISSSENRAWYKANPPLKQTLWSLRNNVNMQQSGILIAMNYVASNSKKFMENFYLKSKRSVEKARTEGPAAYIFPADDPRPAQTASLLRLLQDHGIEVHKTNNETTIEKTEYGKGSYVVRLDQPYSRLADLMLDKQYFNITDPRPYDDVGWTISNQFNVKTVRIEDTSVLDVSMKLINEEVKHEGNVNNLTGGNTTAYLINHDASNQLATFRFANANLIIEAAEAAFEVEENKFNAGTFIIKTTDNAGNLKDVLENASKEYEFKAFSVSEVPEVNTHPLEVPKIAVMHTWSSTQDEGWLRMGLDRLEIPYEYISVHEVRDDTDLRSKYDVILFGPSSSNAMSIVDGIPMTGKPQPWKKTDLTPNIGVVDETDDIRGGLGLEGVYNLYNFVKTGGLFITLSNSSSLPVHFGMAQGLKIKETNELWARGGIYGADISDSKSPIVYGYGDELGVYFNSSPVFGFGSSRVRTVQTKSEGATVSRPSGRGGSRDKDIVQARQQNISKDTIAAFKKEQKDKKKKKTRPRTISRRPRTILRFKRDVKELLISGGISGGKELSGAPAVVDAAIGDGHVVMFSINPFWRNQTVLRNKSSNSVKIQKKFVMSPM